MVTIKEVVLARRIEYEENGSIAAIMDRIGDRDGLEVATLPVMLKLWLVIGFDAPLQRGFHVALEVRTPFRPLAAFDCGTLEASVSGFVQFPIEVPLLVHHEGACRIALVMDRQSIWEQVVFVTLEV